MQGVKLNLHRVFMKGHLCFELPPEFEAREALSQVLALCKEKTGDYVSVTLNRPYKPRSTGAGSQNHHLNGHIMQMCQATGNDYETIKYCVKMDAVEQFGYPYTEINGHIVPKGESKCDSAECAMLIEASHYLAAKLGIVLMEGENEN